MSERSVFREYLEALLIAAIFLGFSNTFVVKTFYIPSSSMENTLLIGDHLFVNRYIFGQTARGTSGVLPGRDIRRGDVVIFRSVEDPQIDLVKRCIGMPGDTLEMREKTLFVNGKQVEDSAYVLHRDPRVFSNRAGEAPDGQRRDNFGPLTVPAAHYFCMGDNHDQSYDSRFWGFVPAENVKGRPVFIYWSYGGGTPDGKWHGWGEKLGQLANTLIGFIPRTRWSRTFHLIR
jgi:signal peptidase I